MTPKLTEFLRLYDKTVTSETTQRVRQWRDVRAWSVEHDAECQRQWRRRTVGLSHWTSSVPRWDPWTHGVVGRITDITQTVGPRTQLLAVQLHWQWRHELLLWRHVARTRAVERQSCDVGRTDRLLSYTHSVDNDDDDPTITAMLSSSLCRLHTRRSYTYYLPAPTCVDTTRHPHKTIARFWREMPTPRQITTIR